jgi:two-component system CheB/CheR fusion protein
MSPPAGAAAGVALPGDPQALIELEGLLGSLRQHHGLDFSAYKRPSLLRRVLLRMQTAGAPDFTAYLERLQSDPAEAGRLFDAILINVTGFFRDPTSWEYLRDHVVPRLVDGEGRPDIRIWSAGCASGEEVYSIAMLLASAMGADAFRSRVRLYATDLDEAALEHARQGVYAARIARDVPPGLLDEWFDRRGDSYAVSPELRRAIIFGRHDLVQDAPISRIDLLICRNCLMYFTPEAQARIIARYHFALAPGGMLFLGKAETLLALGSTFEPVDLKRRLFTKVPAGVGAAVARPGAIEAAS